MALFGGSLANVGGTRRGSKLTLDNLGSQIGPALLSCTLNVAGGAAARTASEFLDGYKAGWGMLGVTLISVGLKTVFQGDTEASMAIRELGAGMAGYVGDEVVDNLVQWWRSETYDSTKPWEAGKVVWLNGKYYKAAEAIKDSSLGMPGEDPRWVRLTGVTYNADDIKHCARMIFLDSLKVGKISTFIATEIAKTRGWDAQQQEGVRSDVEKSLKAVGESLQKM